MKDVLEGTSESSRTPTVKLHRRVPQVSYLAYPHFDRDPHPALTGSLVVHLRTLQVRYIDYRTTDSPPILHRKETFVPADYPLHEKFARLTRQEERWGLYEHPAAIGTRQAWERLLAEKGVRLTGHRVTRVARAVGNAEQRHSGCKGVPKLGTPSNTRIASRTA